MPSYSRRVQIPGRTSKELYDRVSQDIDHFLSKVPLGKFEISRYPDRNELQIKGSMFSATLTCEDDEMELKAQLSLLAAPFKSKLDDSITRWLSKTFNLAENSSHGTS